MRKFVAVSVIVISLLALMTACGGGNTAAPQGGQSGEPSSSAPPDSSNAQQPSGQSEDFPTDTITLIVAFSPGGETDTGARILAPYVEKELGVALNIVNKSGAGGWVGWAELVNSKPDGYTIGYVNTPNLITGYLNPSANRKENLDSFAFIANHVTDAGAIAIRVDEDRFTNINELVEYAKTHEVTSTSTGVGSDDHVAALKLNRHYGTRFQAVHGEGAAESVSNVLGGHVDVLFANVGSLTPLHKNGEIKVVAVMSEERSPFLPDVPTLKESGYEVYSWSSRGIAAPAGIDPDRLQILRDAFAAAIRNEEHIAKMAEMGLQVDLKVGDEYEAMLRQEEQGVAELLDLLGWK